VNRVLRTVRPNVAAQIQYGGRYGGTAVYGWGVTAPLKSECGCPLRLGVAVDESAYR